MDEHSTSGSARDGITVAEAIRLLQVMDGDAILFWDDDTIASALVGMQGGFRAALADGTLVNAVYLEFEGDREEAERMQRSIRGQSSPAS